MVKFIKFLNFFSGTRGKTSGVT